LTSSRGSGTIGLTMIRRSLIVALLVGAFASAGAAKDIYVAQAATGSGTGTDCANARPATFFNSSANWGPGANQISPGDTVHLCGTFTSVLGVQGSGVSGSPTTILFEPNAKMSASFWPATGALVVTNKRFVILDGGTNGIIEATNNGTARVNQTHSVGIEADGCDDCEIRNFSVLNMYVRTPGSSDSRDFGSGIVVQGGNRIKIHDNIVRHAKTGMAYSVPGGTSITNVRIFNNTISNISTGIIVGSGNNNAVGDDVIVYSNDISDGVTWCGNWAPPPGDGHHHNDGIHVFAVHAGATFTNLAVHSNFIHGDWCTGNTTGWIFVEQLLSNYQVYNNLLTATNSSAPTDGFIAIKGPGGNTKVYNNTIIGSNTRGIGLGFCCGTPNNDVKNNIVRSVGTGIFVDDSSSLTGSNFNAISQLNSSVEMFYQIGFFSFPGWQTRLGFDASSITLDPVLDLNGKPGTTSPIVDRGTNLSTFFTLDKVGRLRGEGNNLWDIGCFEFARPAPPTNLR